jgi:uncharacterized protein (DUF2235 family)
MKRRNIAVFFDGTGQDRNKPSAEWSNVILLHDATLAITDDNDVVQSLKYVNGVGTRKGEELTGNGFGIDLDKRVEEAYDFLYEKVNNAIEDTEEPHLYLFGFSRGAFAARWLASLIQFAGICKDGLSAREVMRSHKNNDTGSIVSWKKRGLLLQDVTIDFLGVWDTVEASIDPNFGIADVPRIVKKVFHALAIDEWRCLFNPTRFNPSRKVHEVWFPGCHTDVGGGYVERAIANESLKWMASGARTAGLLVDEETLVREISERSDKLMYHDELMGNKLWEGLNQVKEGVAKFFRKIGDHDLLHSSVVAFAASAPADRQQVPQTCIVLNDGGNTRSFSEKCSNRLRARV